jgi:ADP-heptose:LPS heptosyltransferase
VTVVALAPFKLGDFVQATPLLAALSRQARAKGRELALLAGRPETAAAATLSGLVDTVIQLADEELDGRASARLPQAPALLVNLSSAPASLGLAAALRPQEIWGPSLDGGRLRLPPPQRLARAIMIVERRLGLFNLVDVWRHLPPTGLEVGRRLHWPRTAGGGPVGRRAGQAVGLAESQAASQVASQADRRSADRPDGQTVGQAAAPPDGRSADQAFGSSARPPGGQPGAWPDAGVDAVNRAGSDGGDSLAAFAAWADGVKPAPLVGLHLGCGHRLRRWPTERFAALAARLAPAGVVLFGTAGEKALAARFLALTKARPDAAASGVFDAVSGAASSAASDVGPILNLTGRTTLAELGAILARLELFVSSDTGVMHLAAAVGTQTLALFGGPALAGETGPYAPGAVMVQGFCECSPCAESRRCPEPFCPGLPDVEAAASAALSLLGRRPWAPQPARRAERRAVALQAGADFFGQILIPTSPLELDQPAGTAWAVRAAGAAVLKGRPAPPPPAELLAALRPGPRLTDDPQVRRRLAAIAEFGFESRQERRRFVQEALAQLDQLPQAGP